MINLIFFLTSRRRFGSFEPIFLAFAAIETIGWGLILWSILQ